MKLDSRRGRLALVLAALLLAAGCAPRVATQATRKPAPEPPRSPAALFLAVQHPHLTEKRSIEFSTFVLRLGLEGDVTTLPISPADRTDIRPDADGARILYSKTTTDTMTHELRMYDVASGDDSLVLSGTVLAYGWDATATVALTGSVDRGMSPSFYPSGVNITVADPTLWVGRPGQLTTSAIPATRTISADLSYIGSDATSRYFTVASGKLVALAREDARPSLVATWGIIQYDYTGPRTSPHRPTPTGFPLLGNGLRAESCTRTGLPMWFSTSSATSSVQSLEVRRLSDWRTLRTLPVPEVGEGALVLSPDLTRYVRPVSAEVDGRRNLRVIQEVDAGGRASQVATVVAGEERLWALGYVGPEYDFVYAAMTAEGDANVYLVDRGASAPRKLTTLTRAQLIGYDERGRTDLTPGRLVGIEYER